MIKSVRCIGGEIEDGELMVRYLQSKGLGDLLNGAIMGLPVGAGILAHVAAAAGFAGKYGKQLHDIGDGALAAYFARLGARVGHNWARTAPRVRGERMMASGERRPLSPAEVGAYAMAAR